MTLALALTGCSVRKPAGPAEAKGKAIYTSPHDLAREVGIPLYPGAHVPGGRSRAPYKDPQGATRYEIVMVTADPPQKVLAFYRKEIEDMGGGGPMVVGRSRQGHYVMLMTAREGGDTIVTAKVIAYPKGK